MSKKSQIIKALFVMLLWGTLFPMVKLGFKAYDISGTGDILLFAGVRFVICGAVIFGYSFIKNKPSFKSAKPKLFSIFMIGFFAIILHYGFTYAALTSTDSSKTAILKQIGALLYVCCSSFFIKDDNVTWKKVVGVVLGFLGIVAINTNITGISFTLGDAFIIAASLCTVFSNVIGKNVFKTVNPITSAGISQIFGGVILLVVGFLFGGRMVFRFDTSLLILLYICFASVLSYCMWYLLLDKGHLSNLFIIKFAEPLFACVFGAIILGENIFQIQYLAAFVLIAGGIYISNK